MKRNSRKNAPTRVSELPGLFRTLDLEARGIPRSRLKGMLRRDEVQRIGRGLYRLRDAESVPLSESVEAFFEREVKPHVPDAWIDTTRRDERDGEVGIVGYEINFNRYFYRYIPPRPLEEIESEIRGIETDILRMLAEVTGSKDSP